MYTRPRIQRKRAESLGFCPRRYTDIIAATGFRSNYYTEIISNYTFRFVRRVRGLSRICLSYNIITPFHIGPSIYVSLSPLNVACDEQTDSRLLFHILYETLQVCSSYRERLVLDGRFRGYSVELCVSGRVGLESVLPDHDASTIFEIREDQRPQ